MPSSASTIFFKKGVFSFFRAWFTLFVSEIFPNFIPNRLSHISLALLMLRWLYADANDATTMLHVGEEGTVQDLHGDSPRIIHQKWDPFYQRNWELLNLWNKDSLVANLASLNIELGVLGKRKGL